MLSGISRKRSIRSNPYWFTEFCNSQCLSHFAAPFIVVRAETSVAESCSHFACVIARRLRRSDYEFSGFGCIGLKCVGFLNRGASSTREQRGEGGPSRYTAATKKVCEHSSLGWMVLDWCGNDPSAGSPTETLLRLHLPLNHEVWATSSTSLPM